MTGAQKTRIVVSPTRRAFLGYGAAMIAPLGLAACGYDDRRPEGPTPRIPPGYRVATRWGARGYIIEGPGGRVFYYDKQTQWLTHLNPQLPIGPQIEEIEQRGVRFEGN